jgi:hypothetical protein
MSISDKVQSNIKDFTDSKPNKKYTPIVLVMSGALNPVHVS